MAALKFALFSIALAAASAHAAEQRIALVIGNAAYPTARLKNPVNDANAIAAKLKALGFEVTQKNEATQRELTRAISQFGQNIKLGSVALFYYAGHGLQVRGRNFLVPIDAEIENEASARSEGVDLDLLLEQLGPARLSMVILDACRNNPFENRMRTSRGMGLAQVDAPKGVLLAYATAPGKVASDGEGANGLYTAELLKALDKPGLKVEEVFKAVRVNVTKATANEQIPWESSSLTGDFYFRPADTRVADESAKKEQAQFMKAVVDERKRREEESKAFRDEMEKLRAEIRQLREAPAPAPAPVAKTEPAPVVAAKPEPKPPVAVPKAEPKSEPKPAPTIIAKVDPAPAPKPEPVRPAPPPAEPPKLRGDTFAKRMALLLDIRDADELDRLLAVETDIRRRPYHSALALGFRDGQFFFGRAWRERTPRLAQSHALENCGRNAPVAPTCKIVMTDGEFNEAAFDEVMAGLDRKKLADIRKRFFTRLPPIQTQQQ